MTATTTEERKMVLEMLADGKINVEDAQRLLDKLQNVESSRPAESSGPTEHRAKATGKKQPKHLRIQTLDGNGDEEVNLRIPIGLIRAGLALESFLPSWAVNPIIIGTSPTNVANLDSDYLRKNLDDLDLNFDSGDGESIHIYSE